MLVRLASEEKVAELGQHFDNLATVVSKALGGSEESDKKDVKEIGSWDELVTAFQGLGGHIGA